MQIFQIVSVYVFAENHIVSFVEFFLRGGESAALALNKVTDYWKCAALRAWILREQDRRVRLRMTGNKQGDGVRRCGSCALRLDPS